MLATTQFKLVPNNVIVKIHKTATLLFFVTIIYSTNMAIVRLTLHYP